MKTPMTPTKCKLSDLIEGAFSEISNLAEEMREAFDNTPENLQASGVGEARGLAADELENYVDAPSMPDILSEIEVEFLPLAPRKRGYSRRDRCSQATYELGVAVEAIEEMLQEPTNEQEAAADEVISDEQRDASEDRKGELEEVRDECQNAIDGCDGVEFPGMFG